MLLAMGCRAAGQEPASDKAQRSLRNVDGQLNANPFIQTAAGSSSGVSVSSCLSMTLHVSMPRGGAALSGELTAKNRCPYSVAVMTAPVELRIRLSAQMRFPAESGIGNAYAIAYLFADEVGLGRDAFRGDGGVTVTAPPEFAVVGPNQDGGIPVRGKLPLELLPGKYGLALMTMVVPTAGASAKPGSIEIDNSVERFQRGRAGDRPRMVLSEAVVRLAPAAFFLVE